jgi:UDP-N-acetylglucosamine--N-acetylmuramyl-(pentapeptide) pyrophosphoryl-undecaprenol N-acetylglucosamine transferase
MKRSIVFAGGGTIGPVAPLLAVAEEMLKNQPDLSVVWAGTDSGPERDLVEPYGFPFFEIPVAKLPRYVSKKLLTAPFDFFRARHAARNLMRTVLPSVVVSAGGFTAVPIVRAAYAFHIPSISHQLDCLPGLSNRLIARKSRYVTTSFAYSDNPFGKDVVSYPIPTPTRFRGEDLPAREDALRAFGLDPTKKTVFVMGGGTGAEALNRAMARIAPSLLPEIQIIHLTGRGKGGGIGIEDPGYVRSEFFTDEIVSAYAAADLVVSRAGIGAISELAATKKAAILIPLPDSPQIANAEALDDAVVTILQDDGDWLDRLDGTIIDLLRNDDERTRLGRTLNEAFPTDRGQTLAQLAMSVMV